MMKKLYQVSTESSITRVIILFFLGKYIVLYYIINLNTYIFMIEKTRNAVGLCRQALGYFV